MHWFAQSKEYTSINQLFLGRAELITQPLTIKLNPATPFTILPSGTYNQARAQLLNNIGTGEFQCDEHMCIVFRPCSQIQGPALTFQMNNGKFWEVPRSSLLIDGAKFKLKFDLINKSFNQKPFCVLGVATNFEYEAQGQITLGTEFMRHYYAVIDHEN